MMLTKYWKNRVLHTIGLVRSLCPGGSVPEHVWQAWCDQLLEQVQKADLEKLGVDSQAAAMIPAELARRMNALPIRCMGSVLIVAVAEHNTDHIAAEIRKATDMSLRFVVADAQQLKFALGVYCAEHLAA